MVFVEKNSFERPPVQLSTRVVRRMTLFGGLAVVPGFLFVVRKQIGGFVGEILSADNLVGKQYFLSHNA